MAWIKKAIKNIVRHGLFIILACAMSGFWVPLFQVFTYDEAFLGCWVLMAAITAVVMNLTAQHPRLGAGRCLAYIAGMGAIGVPITIALGTEMVLVSLGALIVFICGFFATQFLNFKIEPDHMALDGVPAQSKHLKAFPEYYRTELQDWMHEQEERRKKVVPRMWIGVAVAVPAMTLLTGLVDFYLLPDGDFGDFMVMVFFLAAQAMGNGAAVYPYTELQDEMKEKLLEKLTAYFGDLKHHKSIDHFRADRFVEVGLIGDYNRTDFEDGFVGKHDHVDFILTEADLKKVTGHGKHRRTEYIFNGLMIVMNFPMPFKGRTLVLRDKGKLGNWVKNKTVDMDRANLVASKFEKLFEVYTTDQVEARVILTPDLMDNLVTLGRMVSDEKDDAAPAGHMELAFDNSFLMITIATSTNLFEVGHLDADMTDTARIASFAREVSMIYDIIDILELNRKAQTLSAQAGQ